VPARLVRQLLVGGSSGQQGGDGQQDRGAGRTTGPRWCAGGPPRPIGGLPAGWPPPAAPASSGPAGPPGGRRPGSGRRRTRLACADAPPAWLPPRLLARTAGSDRALGGLAVSPEDVWRPWRPVPAPTFGGAGDAVGQAPVGLPVKLGQVRHGQRDTQLVVVHLGPVGWCWSGQYATDAPEGGHHPKVEGEGESSRPGRCGEPAHPGSEACPSRRRAFSDLHGVGGHGKSNRYNGGQEWAGCRRRVTYLQGC
jgi:hypothetical protein